MKEKKGGRGIKNKRCEDYKINHWNVRKHLTELLTLPPPPLFLLHVTTMSNLFSFPHSGHREDIALHEQWTHISSHLPACRPPEADGFSMVLINFHSSTSQVRDLSSQHTFEERKSYFLFSRFGDGRKWKKCTGFAVQVEINPVFLRNFVFFRINTDMTSTALRSHWDHWTFLQSRLQGVELGITKRIDRMISGCPHVTRLGWVSQSHTESLWKREG